MRHLWVKCLYILFLLSKIASPLQIPRIPHASRFILKSSLSFLWVPLLYSTHPQHGASNIHSINIRAVSETPHWAGNIYWWTWCPDPSLLHSVLLGSRSQISWSFWTYSARTALCWSSGKNFWGHKSGEEAVNGSEAMPEKHRCSLTVTSFLT